MTPTKQRGKFQKFASKVIQSRSKRRNIKLPFQMDLISTLNQTWFKRCRVKNSCRIIKFDTLFWRISSQINQSLRKKAPANGHDWKSTIWLKQSRQSKALLQSVPLEKIKPILVYFWVDQTGKMSVCEGYQFYVAIKGVRMANNFCSILLCEISKWAKTESIGNGN